MTPGATPGPATPASGQNKHGSPPIVDATGRAEPIVPDIGVGHNVTIPILLGALPMASKRKKPKGAAVPSQAAAKSPKPAMKKSLKRAERKGGITPLQVVAAFPDNDLECANPPEKSESFDEYYDRIRDDGGVGLQIKLAIARFCGAEEPEFEECLDTDISDLIAAKAALFGKPCFGPFGGKRVNVRLWFPS